MSEKLPKQSENEEVDLGQLFNAIGRLFEKLFSFIGSIFKGVFSIIVYALKPFVKNFKLVAIVLLASGLIGFAIDKTIKPVYKSDMLVKPYFDSKYQLANNVDYFNALIKSDNIKELSQVFEIDTIEAQELVGFEMKIGPETPNDLLLEFNDYLKQIDSSLVDDVSYEKYVENRDVLSGSVFSIKAQAYKNDIFTSLEKGFEKTLRNSYSGKLKDIRDRSFEIRKTVYKEELKRIDSFQRIYLEVIKNESEDGNLSLGMDGLIPLTKEKTVTREYELFREELKIRDTLRSLDEILIKENDFYDILSGFEEVGTNETSLMDKYSVLLPIISFILFISVFILIKVFKFIKNYE